MALLEKLTTDIRIEIADREAEIWEADEIVRAIEKAVSLMSRLLFKRDVIETTIVRTISSESLVIANSTGTLAYKPIKADSVTITGKILDTDYRINYLTGVITEIGSNLGDDTYTVSYELDPLLLDISTLLPDYIRIDRVEYPAGENPPSTVAFDVKGGFLSINTGTLTEDKHLRISYYCKWTPPTTNDDGDYPSHLNDIVIIGAAGEALIFKAEEYTHLAKDTLDDAVDVIEGLSAVTFPDAPDISTYLTAAISALTAAADALSDAETTVDSIDAALALADAAFDNLPTRVTTGLGYLTTGAPFINTGTRGKNVGATYGDYASHVANLLRGHSDEGNGQIAIANTWEAKAGRQSTIGNSYVNEAVQRIAIISRLLDKYATEATVSNQEVSYYTAQAGKATQLLNISVQYLNTAGRYLASGQAKINEMLSTLLQKPEMMMQRSASEQRSS